MVDSPIKERVQQQADVCGNFYQYTFRAAIVGAPRSGKTFLFTQLICPDGPSDSPPPALATDFGTQAFVMADYCHIRLQVWDTGSAAHARAATLQLFTGSADRRCDAAVVCVDVTRMDALVSAESWVTPLRQVRPDLLIIICATQAEKEKARRKVSIQAVEGFATKWGAEAREVSGKSKLGVQELFFGIATSLYARRRAEVVIAANHVSVPPKLVDPPPPAHEVLRDLRNASLDPDFRYKYLLVGPRGAGKSAILARFADGIFDAGYEPTEAPEPATVVLRVDGLLVRCQIWDLPGVDDAHQAADLFTDPGPFLRGPAGLILVVDASSATSLPRLQAYHHLLPSVPTVLCLTKMDLAAVPTVAQTQAQQWASAHFVPLFDCSAYSGHNTDTAIFSLTSEVFRPDFFIRLVTPPAMHSSCTSSVAAALRSQASRFAGTVDPPASPRG